MLYYFTMLKLRFIIRATEKNSLTVLYFKSAHSLCDRFPNRCSSAKDCFVHI